MIRSKQKYHHYYHIFFSKYNHFCNLNVTFLLQLQRDQNLGKISQDAYSQQAVEILAALKKLGETVSCLV